MQKNEFLITFKLRTTPGRQVYIRGDFSSWRPKPMKDEYGDGTYLFQVKLEPGDYCYQYIVDGSIFDVPYIKEYKTDKKTDQKYYVKHVFSSRPDMSGKKTAGNDTLVKTLAACRESAKTGEKKARNALGSIEKSLALVLKELRESVSQETKLKSVDETTQAIRKEFDNIEMRFGLLPVRIKEELDTLKSRNSDFTIVLFGRTMAGKSTLMEFLTDGTGVSIGTGGQRTTRDVRSYYWNGLEVVDVPGICAADGGDDEGVALEAVKRADLVLFLITDDAPTPSEAKFLNLVRSQGKPVLGVMNVKLDPYDDDETRDINRMSERDVDYFLHELKELMAESHCHGIENQFNEFLQHDVSGAKVYFIPVHLLAGFASKKVNDKKIAARLYAASNVARLLELITNTIKIHGCEYRLKSFLDTVIRPLQDFAAELFRQCLLSGNSGRIVLQKKRALLDWQEEYKTNCQAKINKFIREEQRKISEAIPAFAEDNYDNSSAGSVWNARIKKIGLETKAKSLCEEIQADLRKKLEDLNNELQFEIKFSAPTIDITPEPITDWKRIWNWSGILAGVGFTIAAFWWNPAGWIAAGVGLLTWIGSFFFDDREEKRKRARNELEKHLRDQVSKMFEKLNATLTGHFENQILKKQFSSAVKSMGQVTDSLFKLSEQQRKLASSISAEIVNMNGILVDTILEANSSGWNNLQGAVSVGRIPGEVTMVILPAKIDTWQKIGKLLGTSLKETVRFVISCDDNPWNKIRKILNLLFETGRTNLSYEEKINIAHLVPPNDCLAPDGELTPEFRARILLVQQLTGAAVDIKEE